MGIVKIKRLLFLVIVFTCLLVIIVKWLDRPSHLSNGKVEELFAPIQQELQNNRLGPNYFSPHEKEEIESKFGQLSDCSSTKKYCGESSCFAAYVCKSELIKKAYIHYQYLENKDDFGISLNSITIEGDLGKTGFSKVYNPLFLLPKS